MTKRIAPSSGWGNGEILQGEPSCPGPVAARRGCPLWRWTDDRLADAAESEPRIPLLDREHWTKGFFTRADFAFDAKTNVFICPGGKHLRSSGLVRPDGAIPMWRTPRTAEPAPTDACCPSLASDVHRPPPEAARASLKILAEGVGFEPTRACAPPVFKTGALSHSATPPLLQITH